MNKVIITGRLTADPELRQTQSGIASCRFTVAVNRKYKNEQTGEYDADFISCTAWRQTAEFVSRYFNKGKMIALEGSLRTGKYQDKNHSDVTHYTTEVYVDNVEFVGGKNENGGGVQEQPQAQTQAAAPASTAAQKLAQKADEESLDQFYEILNGDDMPF